MVRRLLILSLAIILMAVATGCGSTSGITAGSSSGKGVIKITVGKS